MGQQYCCPEADIDATSAAPPPSYVPKTPSSSPKLAFLYCDINDVTIGKACQADQKNMLQFFDQHGYHVRCVPFSVQEIHKCCQKHPGATHVVHYFSCHGRSDNKQLAVGDGLKISQLALAAQGLQSDGTQTVFITDCCYNPTGDVDHSIYWDEQVPMGVVWFRGSKPSTPAIAASTGSDFSAMFRVFVNTTSRKQEDYAQQVKTLQPGSEAPSQIWGVMPNGTFNL